MKSWVILLTVAFLAGCTAQIQTLEEYNAKIDYSCSETADCVIKDVHNCCGYFPKCVNRDAQTNPELVQELCKDQDRFSVCGFDEITECNCVNNRCEAVTAP